MVFILDAHFIMRTYGVNETFRFVEGILLYQKNRQIREKKSKQTYFTSYVRTHVELPSYISTMHQGHCSLQYTCTDCDPGNEGVEREAEGRPP